MAGARTGDAIATVRVAMAVLRGVDFPVIAEAHVALLAPDEHVNSPAVVRETMHGQYRVLRPVAGRPAPVLPDRPATVRSDKGRVDRHRASCSG